MPQFVAFLRGLNVGGHRVKIDRELGVNTMRTKNTARRIASTRLATD